MRERFQLYFGKDLLITRTRPAATIDYLLWHIQDEAIRRTGDFLLIHAGSVVTPHGDGLLLPAAMESGKTTLTAALVRAGFDYLSDELAVLDPVTRQLFPFPKALTIKKGSFERFPELRAFGSGLGNSADRWHVPSDFLRPSSLGIASSVQFVIAPTYRADGPTELTGATRGQGAMDLANNALNLPIYRARALLVIADVVSAASCYRLRFNDLDQAVEAISLAVKPRG